MRLFARYFVTLVGCSLLLAGSLAIPVRAQVNVCEEVTGRTERGEYDVSSIQTRMYYSVYLPPCYDFNTETFPVLYLMHGSNEDDGQWLRLGLAEALDAGIASGELPPMIAVLPFGNWIANENRFGTDSWGQIFLNQFMPLIEENYRITPGRESRAIGGISRGGFWAFHIGLRNPVLFGAIGGHSAFFDRFHANAENNPLDLALNAIGIESVRIWLDRGRDDYAAPGLEIMHERLNERGLAHIYNVYPEGQHHNSYWGAHLPDYLQFYIEPWLDQPELSLAPPTATPSLDLGILLPDQTPTPTPRPLPEPSEGYYLLLPVVAFPSRIAAIETERLHTINLGLADPSLVLTESTAAILETSGVTVSGGIRIIPDEALYNILWRDRTLFTLLPFDQLMPRYRVLLVDEQHPLDGDLDVYPFAFRADTPNFYPERLTRLVMSGVTALTRRTINALDENGIEWAASGIADYVKRADFFHTSNEVSIYPTCPETTGPRMSGALSFCSKEAHFELFNLLELDIVELSGNHNNDYGYQPYLDTLDWYEDNGIATVGGGRTLEEARAPLVLDHNGNSIAMLSCNWVGPYFALVNEDPQLLGGVRPGAASCDLNWLREILPQLAEAHDLVVVSVQYWEFDQYTPTPQQRSDFRLLADLGADVVLGSQAHFPQTYEFYASAPEREAFIHYGLGNLFFDQQFFAGVRFFMNQLFIYEGQLMTVDVFTGMIEGQGRPRPMSSDERDNFLFLMFNQYGGF